jgi:hypothetical protein
MSCKTYKFLQVLLDKLGRRVGRRDTVYRCAFTPELPRVPDSITGTYHSRFDVQGVAAAR